jgi:hypothetical protein
MKSFDNIEKNINKTNIEVDKNYAILCEAKMLMIQAMISELEMEVDSIFKNSSLENILKE